MSVPLGGEEFGERYMLFRWWGLKYWGWGRYCC
jgi:hypothetical protein